MGWPIIAADVRAALRQSSTSVRVEDPDLLSFAQQAMKWVESQVGPCRGQAFSTVVRSRGLYEVVLDHAAAAVTAVTVDGEVFEAFDFDPVVSVRIVLGPFPPGRLVLTCTAPAVPPGTEEGEASVVEGATIDLAAHWWLQSRPGSGGSDGAGSPMGFAIPNRVSQKVEPFVEVGGIA